MPKAKKTARSTSNRKKQSAASKEVVQEALEVTWPLKGHLKNAQISYIRAGTLLADVRDRKLYEALKHPDMETYAEQRLQLGRASLYLYLQVHDWIVAYHKEWLEPKPKGFIPDLSDAADLIWIERELARKDIDAAKRAALEELRQKGLDGRLRKRDLAPWRRQEHGAEEALKSFLSRLRALRMRGSQLASMPGEAIANLDSAIEIVKNALTLQRAGLELADQRWPPAA